MRGTVEEDPDPEQFDGAAREGTERAFTGKYWRRRTTAPTSAPVAARSCSLGRQVRLGCGWPSYTRAIDEGRIVEHVDTSHGMVRHGGRRARAADTSGTFSTTARRRRAMLLLQSIRPSLDFQEEAVRARIRAFRVSARRSLARMQPLACKPLARFSRRSPSSRPCGDERLDPPIVGRTSCPTTGGVARAISMRCRRGI
jgi:hypothetical protein